MEYPLYNRKRLYMRRLTGPELLEPYARTKGSAFRLWNQDMGNRIRKFSYPFEVVTRLEHGAPSDNAALCRLEVYRIRVRRSLLGSCFRFVIRLWVVHRETMENIAPVFIVFSAGVQFSNKMALSRGSASAFTMYEQLTREGYNERTMRGYVAEWLARGIIHEESTGREFSDREDAERDQGETPSPNPIPIDSGRKRRALGDARQDDEQ